MALRLPINGSPGDASSGACHGRLLRPQQKCPGPMLLAFVGTKPCFHKLTPPAITGGDGCVRQWAASGAWLDSGHLREAPPHRLGCVGHLMGPFASVSSSGMMGSNNGIFLRGSARADPVHSRGALRVVSGPERRFSVDYLLSQLPLHAEHM